jgi:hypothetical protein
MSQNRNSEVAVIGIDIGKNSFHVVGLDDCGAIVLRQKWPRGQVDARRANMPPCLIGMEACVGAHHLSRKPKAFGHDARLMPAKYVRPYSKGQKNDFRDAEAIAEASGNQCSIFLLRQWVASHSTRSAAHVRFGSKADIGGRLGNVCFTPKSGHQFQRGFDICFSPEIKHGGGKRSATCEYDCEGGRPERPREDTF